VRLRAAAETIFFSAQRNGPKRWAQANLAMARRDLKVIEQEFYMSHPAANQPRQGGQNADQYFQPTAQR
jgi:hypothetical protein